MQADKVIQWLQILCGVGLIIALGIVGWQINQSTKIAFITAAFQQETDHYNAMLGPNPNKAIVKGILEPENLTPEEIWIMRAQVDWYLSMMRRNARLASLGAFDAGWQERLIGPIGGYFGQVPVQREILMATIGDADWLVKLKEVAATQKLGGAKQHVDYLLKQAQSYKKE